VVVIAAATEAAATGAVIAAVVIAVATGANQKIGVSERDHSCSQSGASRKWRVLFE
jgi:hypothetical protein